MQSVEKLKVCTDVAYLTSNFSSDDNKLAEFVRIHMLFTLLWLILVFQYLLNPSLMVVKVLVCIPDSSFVVHLLEPGMKRCLNGVLCSLGSSTNKEDLDPLLTTSHSLT